MFDNDERFRSVIRLHLAFFALSMLIASSLLSTAPAQACTCAAPGYSRAGPQAVDGGF
jgi:hypothetical protein